jgi:hypothetical protein
MNILAVDGVPVNSAIREEKSTTATEGISTSKKVQILRAADEDFEFYPTTPEIMEAMNKDIWKYLRNHNKDYAQRQKEELYIKTSYEHYTKAFSKNKKTENLVIGSFLDIGTGDGRVLDFFSADKNYGIEIARAQADDLIRKGIFIIGRNYWDVSLIDQYFSLIYSNPPFSSFVQWVSKLLVECNFSLLYLVMPVRWQNHPEITNELKRYEATIVGEFDFSKADREARGKVHLVRVNAPWVYEDERGQKSTNKYQQTLEDAFERWVREYIGDFEEKEDRNWEEERQIRIGGGNRALSPVCGRRSRSGSIFLRGGY